MKSFVVSVMLLLALISLCVWYSVHAVSVCDTVKNEIESLEDDGEKWNSPENKERISGLISKWEKERRVLSVGMEGKTVEKAEELFLQLFAAWEADSFPLYLNARKRLLELFSEFASENTVSLSQFL